MLKYSFLLNVRLSSAVRVKSMKNRDRAIRMTDNIQISYFFERISKYSGFIAAFLVVVLSLLVSYDAMMRYLFSAGSIALQEIEWHLFDIKPFEYDINDASILSQNQTTLSSFGA